MFWARTDAQALAGGVGKRGDQLMDKVVGYAISRSMDARIAVAALKALIRNRAPPKGGIHHSDRGSQYVSEAYGELLAARGLTGARADAATHTTIPRRRA